MTTAIEEKGQKISFKVGHAFKVDREAGRLSDLVLIEADREATGHGLWIDAKTLEGGLESVRDGGGRLRAFVGHPSLVDMLSDSGGRRLLKMPGYFDTVEIDEGRLVARSFEFFDAFRENYTEEYETILELAEKTPELFGLSIEAHGHGVFVDAEGNEYSEAPEDVDLEHDGMPVFRIATLTAAAFVDEPAATSGLFSRFAKAFGIGAGGDVKTQLIQVAEAVVAWAEEQECASLSASPSSGVPHGGSGESLNIESIMIEEIKEHFKDDAARRDRAILSFASNSTQTLEQIEAALTEEDRVDELEQLRDTNATLQARNAELEADVVTAETERDAWKEKFESGHSGELNLGAPSSASTDGDNPWAKGSINRTRQAEILKRAPEEAKALKAAADAGNDGSAGK